MTRTSLTDPIRIDTVAAGGGLIGITFCPGKRSASVYGEPWRRDLNLDLATIGRWAPDAVVTLMEEDELHEYGVSGLPDAMRAKFPVWLHLPIRDLCAPDSVFESEWICAGSRLRGILRVGGRVLVHCRGGIGRAGMIAARLLIELGERPEAAIAAVRAARSPSAIETPAQIAHVLACRPALDKALV